jgi:hypothetical protein
LRGSAKLQVRGLIIFNPAHLPDHQPREKMIHECQNAFMTPEIFVQVQHLAGLHLAGLHLAGLHLAGLHLGPLVGVLLKDFGVGPPEPVDALFDIAHQKPVGPLSLAG